MDDTEEMVALKKAYAEMILNTAKEAAARVMSAQRKADKYEKELISTKDEAVRMLLRLKLMIDTQRREAEITSLNDKRRISELEAQLDEAEGVILDLRAKLNHVEDQLEDLKDKYKPSFGRKEIVYLPSHSQLPTVGQSFPHSLPVPEPTPVNSEVQISLPTPCTLAHEFITSQEEIARPSSRKDPRLVNTLVFASVTTEGKEPKLYNDEHSERIPTISLLKASTLVHEYVSEEIGRPSSRCDSGTVNCPDFDAGTTESKEPEDYNRECSQKIQVIETISLAKSSTLVHEVIRSPEEIAKPSFVCDPCSMNSPILASGTTQSRDSHENKCSQRVTAIETCLAADKLHPVQETKSLPKSDPKTKKKKRYAKVSTIPSLRTDKSGKKESFVSQAVYHNGSTIQPVKVHKFRRRTIRGGKRKAASCKCRLAQQMSVALARCNSSVLDKVVCKSGDTTFKVKPASNVECASMLNEKVQLQKYHAVSVVRRSIRKRKIKHWDGFAVSCRKQDAPVKEYCQNNDLVECEVRASQDLLEVEDEVNTKEGIHVNEAFANAGRLAEVEENSTCAGNSVTEDMNLIDVSIASQMQIENAYLVSACCSDAKSSGSTKTPHQPDNDRAIKYTFCRKRKNGSLLKLEDTISSGECSPKKRSGELTLS